MHSCKGWSGKSHLCGNGLRQLPGSSRAQAQEQLQRLQQRICSALLVRQQALAGAQQAQGGARDEGRCPLLAGALRWSAMLSAITRIPVNFPIETSLQCFADVRARAACIRLLIGQHRHEDHAQVLLHLRGC